MEHVILIARKAIGLQPVEAADGSSDFARKDYTETDTASPGESDFGIGGLFPSKKTQRVASSPVLRAALANQSSVKIIATPP